ncbi:MAG: GNAT family N-acetyltransferase [Thermoplasmata archaeon]|nr:GNAT family N-acetyltransferase [Thermoplasmata archaeon]
MTQSSIMIRRARTEDIDAIVQITKDNEHFWSSQVDGAEALARIIAREDNIILVSVDEGNITGFLIGTWDGARAFIHKLSVSPAIQHKGTGRKLVAAGIEEFKKKGAPTVGVSAADGTRTDEEDSTVFWKKVGFEYIPARLMINFTIWGEDEEDHGQIKDDEPMNKEDES